MKSVASHGGAPNAGWRARGRGWLQCALAVLVAVSLWPAPRGGGGVFAAEAGYLLNISTRARIGTGNDVVVCGFVIAGGAPRKVLVRVLGPSLRQFGVADAVADPVMQIIPSGASAPIAQNDNWREGDAAGVGATGLAPYDPLDCALVLALAPGPYTALISGRGGGTGIALVEVYDLDAGTTAPDALRVAATTPSTNAASVSPNLSAVTFSFNHAMAPEVDIDPGSLWGASSYAWSADRRELTMTRISAATALGPSSRIVVTLNPMMGTHRMQDSGGNLLPTYTLTFTVGAPPGVPYVVSTLPETGAIISPTLRELVFNFSEPMAYVEGGGSAGWSPYACQWSSDMKTMKVTRGGDSPLPAGSVVFFSVLPPYYKSAAGVPLGAEFRLLCTVDLDLQRIEADAARGFQWPYFLVVPPSTTAPATLMVEPNNTGTVDDNQARHESSAEALVRSRASFASTVGCPLLVPVFPRPANPPAPEPGGIYTHALDRFSLRMAGSPIERLDRQLLAMVDDARVRLAVRGINVGAKIFMTGFSASGMFTSRFAMLHPDRIKAAACGSPGGWPVAPVASWRGVTLPYPCGISDLATLVGESPNLGPFAQLPLFIYVGSVDTNDALDVRGMSAAEKAGISGLLNSPNDPYIANRWPTAEAIYRSVNSVATFKVYPGVGHSYSTQINSDLAAFFTAHR